MLCCCPRKKKSDKTTNRNCFTCKKKSSKTNHRDCSSCKKKKNMNSSHGETDETKRTSDISVAVSQRQWLPESLSKKTYDYTPETTIEKGELSAQDFFNFYDIIGQGMMGVVFRAQFKPDGTYKAIKFIPNFKQFRLNIANELHCLQISKDCLYTCNYHSHFRVSANLYIVMDLIEGGNLEELISPNLCLPHVLVRIYIKELCLALFFLHKSKIVHRDICPRNIAISSDGHCKLIDFSCSRIMLKPAERFTDVGNNFYKAPEIYLDKFCTKAVDWWSIGVVMFRLICGSTPYDSSEMKKMTVSYQTVTKLSIKYPHWAFNNTATKDFCKGLLEKKPKYRLGSEHEEFQIKNQAYFFGIHWDARESIFSLLDDDEFAHEQNGTVNKKQVDIYNKLCKIMKINKRMSFNGDVKSIETQKSTQTKPTSKIPSSVTTPVDPPTGFPSVSRLFSLF